MIIISFNLNLNQEAQEVIFSRTMTKLFHLEIYFNNILDSYLIEKLNSYYLTLVRNVQMIA